MPSIADLVQQIRAFINNPRKQCSLLQDSAAWNMLCSCLDCIGDTESAIDAYERDESSDDVGVSYILVYGLLQTLFIQQDAVENLCQALSIKYERDPLLDEIRKIRNDSAGHTTKRGGGKGRAYNFISRSGLTKNDFQLMTTYPDLQKPLFRHISLPSLISSQRNIHHTLLSKVLNQLHEEEAEHRKKFRHQRMQEIFPLTLDYYFEKIAEAIHGGKFPAFGKTHFSFVSELVEKFKERINEREISEISDSVTYLLDLLDYPIQELDLFFSGQSQRIPNNKYAYIYLFFLEEHIMKLKQIAIEIDEEYESDP